jgi:hypothetical protein
MRGRRGIARPLAHVAITNELTLRHAIRPRPVSSMSRTMVEALALSRPLVFAWFHFSTWRVPRRTSLSEATKGPTTCNLVELRGHALKNYGVTDMGKRGIATAMTKSDRHDSMFDREVNQFGTAAKSVHLHHLVLMELDSSRRNRKLARNLLRRSSFREQLQNLSLA